MNYTELADIQDSNTFSDPKEDYGTINNIVRDMTQKTQPHGVVDTNVLKYYNIISASDFDKFLLSKQQKQLEEKSIKATEQSIKDKESNRFYNLSLSQILQNTTTAMVEILNDLVLYIEQNDKNIGEILTILTKKDRMIYVGLVIIFLSFLLYFITVTI